MPGDERSHPDVPPEIETPRLTLRAPHPDYAQEINDAIRDSFEELRAWMEWAQKMPTVEESRVQQKRARADFLAREDLPVMLFLGERIVGGSGLHRVDWAVPCFEIGYWVRTPDRGQGYVTEAVEALEALAFNTLGARRVEIRTDTRNTRSRTNIIRRRKSHEHFSSDPGSTNKISTTSTKTPKSAKSNEKH